MASNNQPAIPIFDGEGYEHWSIMMKTLFIYQDLWEYADKGFPENDEETKLKENKKKDAKALYFIQQALHRSLFSRIASSQTSKEAWEILQKEFQGTVKIMAVKLQTLRQSYKNLKIKNNEGVQAYITRVTELVNQMRGLGDTISESMVVGKVLRSVGAKFNHNVPAIEQSNDLTKLTMDELSGSLQAHEARLLEQDQDQVGEKAFQVKAEPSNAREVEKGEANSRGRSFAHGRGRWRGRGRAGGPNHQYSDQKKYRGNICW